MSRNRLAFLAALLGILLSGVASAQETRPLPFFASFIPNVQFAPLYAAIEEGYFQDIGFDLDIQHGDENVGVLLIAQGEPNYGLISGEQVILAGNSGIPVVYVYEWFQKYPVAVVASDTVTLTQPSDLAGLTVGIPGPFGANYTALIALLELGNLTEQDIRVESIGYVAPDILCAGAVQAAMVYSNNEPLELRRRIDAGECGDLTGITVLEVSSVANMVSNGVVTSQNQINNNPEEVAAVTAAFDAGLRSAINNPARAYLHSLKHVDNLPASEPFIAALESAAEAQDEFLAGMADAYDREAVAASRTSLLEALRAEFPASELGQFEVMLASITLWDADQLGSTDPDAWILTRNTLAAMGSVSPDLSLESLYTEQFVPSLTTDTAE